MQLQMEGDNNGGSEQGSGSDDGHFVVALRRMMRKEIEVMVIRTVEEVIKPIVENLIRQVVKEEIQSAQEKFLTGGNRSLANETALTKERSLCLKFLDEVSVPVLTGKEIKGKGDTSIKVALVDKIIGEVVKCGPESSAKVEILVLEASNDDNEDNLSLEDFNNRIIREGDKEKPHFAKSNYTYLKEGVGVLCNMKLGHDARWMKSCKCQLGARMENFSGIKVQEGWTESFMVSDSRSKLYEKHHPPSLSDHVWRLENIGRDGAPCKRLKKENILTVQDFLFLHSIDPQRLQKIVGAGAKIWKATVDHAWTCNIDDKRMCLYYPLSEFKMGVVFDVVGGLKGAIHDSHYVPSNNLSKDKKDQAHKFLLSAFENQKDISYFDDETALMHQFPYRSSYITAASNLEGLSGCDLTISESIDGHNPMEPGTSSQSISSSVIPFGHPNNISDLCSPGSATMGQLYGPYLGVTNQSPGGHSPSLDFPLENFHADGSLMSLIYPERNNLSETLSTQSNSYQRSNARSMHLVQAAAVMLWRIRARKRVMALGGIHVQKRQRT